MEWKHVIKETVVQYSCPISQLNKVSGLFEEQLPFLSLAVQVKSFHHQPSSQRSEVTPHNKV